MTKYKGKYVATIGLSTHIESKELEVFLNGWPTSDNGCQVFEQDGKYVKENTSQRDKRLAKEETERQERSLDTLIKVMNLEIKTKRIARRSDRLFEDEKYPQRHWEVEIMPQNKPTHRITVLYSQGMGHTEAPILKDVLYCLVTDTCSFHNCLDVHEFIEEFGYEDTRKAEEVYEACRQNANKMALLLDAHPTGMLVTQIDTSDC